MLLAIEWRHHRGVQETSRRPLMEPGICMGDGSSTEDAKSAGMSPLRLRVGVFLILLWIVPFWALALVRAMFCAPGRNRTYDRQIRNRP
jgi:hypothetical protein